MGFRGSLDPADTIVYLAGVRGVQSYNYTTERVLRDSRNMILAGDDPSLDYYSHILYNNGILYVSDYTHDKLNRISISHNVSQNTYSLLPTLTIGDGPGAMAFLTY